MRVKKAIVSQKTCVLLRPIFKTRFRSPDMPAINPGRSTRKEKNEWIEW